MFLKGYKVGQKVCVVKKEGIGEDTSISLLKGEVIEIDNGVKVNILNTKKIIAFNSSSKRYFYDIKYFLFKNEKEYKKLTGEKISYGKEFMNIKSVRNIVDKSKEVFDAFFLD